MLVTIFLVPTVVAFLYGWFETGKVRVDSYPPYQPLPPAPPAPVYPPYQPIPPDPTAPEWTYDQIAAWLPADVVRDIEREVALR
jgi:hypothetical protein